MCKIKLPTLAEIEIFYFEAMRLGWAAGGKTQPCPGMPGYNMCEHEGITVSGVKLKLRDFWTTGPNGVYSSGKTVIWIIEGKNRRPIWVMNYQGAYPKELLPIVKAALMKNYGEGVFRGGRGPGIFVADGFVYCNNSAIYLGAPPTSNFIEFAGYETVTRITSTQKEVI